MDIAQVHTDGALFFIPEDKLIPGAFVVSIEEKSHQFAGTIQHRTAGVAAGGIYGGKEVHRERLKGRGLLQQAGGSIEGGLACVLFQDTTDS